MRILMVEDEPDIAIGVVEMLEQHRYQASWVASVEAALMDIAVAPPEVVLLDVMLHGDDRAGYRLAQLLREGGFEGGILFLSARDAIDDRVEGLDAGGDDYLVKPFSFEELRARIRALLRRDAGLKQSRLERGSISIDLKDRAVWVAEQRVDLSAREFALLELFAHHPERIFSAEELLDRLFPNASSGLAVVRVYVRNLRGKLGEGVIKTVPGGYRLGDL
jgi:DNA-binding response OmpR family regulator